MLQNRSRVGYGLAGIAAVHKLEDPAEPTTTPEKPFSFCIHVRVLIQLRPSEGTRFISGQEYIQMNINGNKA